MRLVALRCRSCGKQDYLFTDAECPALIEGSCPLCWITALARSREAQG